jgi:phage terminase small subunit
MARARSPNRDKSYQIFKESNGKITSKEIAAILNEKLTNINSWKNQDRWSEKLKGKVGAPYGSKNAEGNKGGSAPEKNINSYKHGFYSKYLPRQTYDIFQDIENMSPIDILWQNIKIKYAAIIRAQKIMYVKNIKDMTKQLKKTKVQSELQGIKGEKKLVEVFREEEFEIQFAWDKEATFLKAQSDAMRTLTNMIKQYDEMLNKNWDMVTEEQRLRIEALKTKVNGKTNTGVQIIDDIEADVDE